MYVFFILQFVQQFIFTNRSMKWQLFASISSSILLLICPKNEWFYCANFMATISVCFPLRQFIKATFAAFCSASFIGGMLFVLYSVWPKTTFVQLILFLIVTFIILIQLLTSIKAASRKHLTVLCHIKLANEWIEVNGFIDSGNGCVEPISQLPVHFLLPKLLERGGFQEIQRMLAYWDNHQKLPDDHLEVFSKYHCRFISLQTIHSSSSLAIAFPGEWGNSEATSSCYFVFMMSGGRFPNGAQVLFHQSLLHHPILKEGTS